MVSNQNQLRLEGVEIFSTAEDSSGTAQEAKFWVTASRAGATMVNEVYGLHVMTDEFYRKWYWEALMEEETAGDADEESAADHVLAAGEAVDFNPIVFPMVVPAEQVGTRGLVAYMARTFLDVSAPAKINSLAQYLEGPVSSSEHRKVS